MFDMFDYDLTFLFFSHWLFFQDCRDFKLRRNRYPLFTPRFIVLEGKGTEDHVLPHSTPFAPNPALGPLSRKSRKLFGPEKPFQNLRFTYSKKLFFFLLETQDTKGQICCKISRLETSSFLRYEGNCSLGALPWSRSPSQTKMAAFPSRGTPGHINRQFNHTKKKNMGHETIFGESYYLWMLCHTDNKKQSLASS